MVAGNFGREKMCIFIAIHQNKNLLANHCNLPKFAPHLYGIFCVVSSKDCSLIAMNIIKHSCVTITMNSLSSLH